MKPYNSCIEYLRKLLYTDTQENGAVGAYQEVEV